MPDAKVERSEGAALDLLSKFLRELEQLPKLMLEGMLQQAETEDEKEVLQAIGGTLASQFSEVTGYIRERSGRLSVQQQRETEEVLRLTMAGPLVASGSRLAANLAPQVAKIGLVGIVKEIKKIIQMLLEAFGIKLPKWFNFLSLVIDQLLNLFISTGSPSLAGTLSRMEQDYLAELTHLARLRRENELRPELDSEDNS